MIEGGTGTHRNKISKRDNVKPEITETLLGGPTLLVVLIRRRVGRGRVSARTN